MSQEALKEWKPLSVAEIVELFASAEFPWWMVGGYAVELAVGRPVREHGDIDILVLRKDCQALRQFLKKWDCWASDPLGQFDPLPINKILSEHAHDIWCREHSNGSWRMDVKVDESNEMNWHSRRDPRVTLPLSEYGRQNPEGIPYVSPEVLIYYKAKEPRPRDEIDFEIFLPTLNRKQRAWLFDAICLSTGEEHPWLSRLVAEIN